MLHLDMLADDDWIADCHADTRAAAAFLRGDTERPEAPAESGIFPAVHDTIPAPPHWTEQLEEELDVA